MKKTFWIYGLFLGLLLFCFKFSEYWFWYHHNNFDLFIAFVVAISMVLGVWLGYRKKTQKEPFQTPFLNQAEEVIQKSDSDNEIKNALIGTISKREMEVLELINKGMSNQEIADHLFLSPNTIKTHTYRLFEKLEVKNRTLAILKARELGLI
ncbi:MAG TPA: response regulator transcription factor [Saprospiraceae bacterium]|nr:response regulator transcription factor [Saprospiraceae bacterium]HPN70224.1 response regulator transcription factor [Saprospiraceae bacterium]